MLIKWIVDDNNGSGGTKLRDPMAHHSQGKKTLTVKAVKPGQQTYSNKSACMMLLGLATQQFLCLRPTVEQWVNTGALCGEWV